MRQSNRLSPVIHVFMFNGQPVNVRRACGGKSARIERLERKLNLVLSHLGISFE